MMYMSIAYMYMLRQMHHLIQFPLTLSYYDKVGGN